MCRSRTKTKRRKNQTDNCGTPEIVPSPKRIQRCIYRNLQQNSRSIVNVKRAKKAKILLAAIDNEFTPSPKSSNNSCIKETVSNHAPFPATTSLKLKPSRIRKAITMLKNNVGRAKTFIQQRFSPRPSRNVPAMCR
jgi:hypothetical protein